jgi:aminoglycoside 3-N-acetyltransferase I
MTDRPVIQRLTSSDIGHLRALNALFGRAFEEPKAYGSQPPSDAYMGRLLAKEHVIALAAFMEEAIVGGLVAYELDKLESERREYYIYDLAVEDGHRSAAGNRIGSYS